MNRSVKLAVAVLSAGFLFSTTTRVDAAPPPLSYEEELMLMMGYGGPHARGYSLANINKQIKAPSSSRPKKISSSSSSSSKSRNARRKRQRRQRTRRGR